MVACMAFFGFCVIYMLRVNLSVAIVAMTQNRTHTADDGTIAVVRNPTIFNIIRCTEVRFVSFLSGGFTTMAVINPPERKVTKRTSVHLSRF